jgi:hypothetical protein
MNIAIAYALIWISVSVAISVGILVTGSLMPLWAFVLPALISVSSKEGTNND